MRSNLLTDGIIEVLPMSALFCFLTAVERQNRGGIYGCGFSMFSVVVCVCDTV